MLICIVHAEFMFKVLAEKGLPHLQLMWNTEILFSFIFFLFFFLFEKWRYDLEYLVNGMDFSI